VAELKPAVYVELKSVKLFIQEEKKLFLNDILFGSSQFVVYELI